jgi:hypothetical protein
MPDMLMEFGINRERSESFYGPSCSPANCTTLVPVVAVPAIATFPEIPCVESAKLARPLMSDCTAVCDLPIITGVLGCEIPQDRRGGHGVPHPEG